MTPSEPVQVPDGQRPMFDRNSSYTRPVQIWHDSMRNRDRTVRFIGLCIECRTPTWAFDDGENDPRGVLGDAACWPTDLTYRGEEYEVTTCSVCANDYEKYRRAQRAAQAELAARHQGLPSRYPSARIRKI